MRFSEDDYSTLKNALYVAAQQFDDNEKYLRGLAGTGNERLADQFKRQADESRKLQARIEQEVG